MMTSPLGLVPQDLEDVWPAANYDVPVTGDWSSDELDRVRRMLLSLVERTGYAQIINHTDLDLGFLGVPVVDTRGGQGATHHEALARLSAAVKEARSDTTSRIRRTTCGSRSTSRASLEKPRGTMRGVSNSS